MADELELELSYEGDGNGAEAGYDEEVDYGESEGEEPAAPAHNAIPDNKPGFVKEDRGPASGQVDKKVGVIFVGRSLAEKCADQPFLPN
jgi:hypothetical protein